MEKKWILASGWENERKQPGRNRKASKRSDGRKEKITLSMQLPDQQHHPLPAQAPPGEGKAAGREGWETQPRCPTSWIFTTCRCFAEQAQERRYDQQVKLPSQEDEAFHFWVRKATPVIMNTLLPSRVICSWSAFWSHSISLFGIFSTLTCLSTFWRVPTTPLISNSEVTKDSSQRRKLPFLMKATQSRCTFCTGHLPSPNAGWRKIKTWLLCLA